jgi:hypothetical protein
MPYLEKAPEYELWDIYTPYGANPPAARNTALSVYLCPSRHSVSGGISQDSQVNITFSCGCPGGVQFIPGGAVTDYAGNMGDPSPGASGGRNDFFWGGKGTGVLIASRPTVKDPANDPSNSLFTGARIVNPYSAAFALRRADVWNNWEDRFRMADITDGTSNTLMVGEMHIPPDQLNTAPYNGPAYFGRHFTHFSRIAGPAVPFAHSPGDTRAGVYSFGSIHAGGVQFALSDGSTRLISTSISSRLAGLLANRSDGNPVTEF